MPKVGNKHFAYTPKGKAAAKKARKAMKKGKKFNEKKFNITRKKVFMLKGGKYTNEDLGKV